MSIRHTILSKIRRFCRRYEMHKTHFGTLAVRDRAFIRQLETGAPVTLGRIEKAEAFMASYASSHSISPKVKPAPLERAAAPKRKRA